MSLPAVEIMATVKGSSVGVEPISYAYTNGRSYVQKKNSLNLLTIKGSNTRPGLIKY
jgi:hypothetical protein